MVNVYHNHHELANKIHQHGTILRGATTAEDHCMCCGREPGRRNQLHEVEIQTSPDQEYFQIGIGRCEQILRAAIVVRRLASADPEVQNRMQGYEDMLGDPPRQSELVEMGNLLLPELAPEERAMLRGNLWDRYKVTI
jgi:hypothetical protein